MLSQPACIGRKDLTSASSQPQVVSKMDVLARISRHAGKCAKQFGLFTVEREIDVFLSPKSQDAFGKFMQKVA